MKIKSLIIFLVISSFFLTCILSIWKIMSTLQGLSFTNLNITPVFLIGILLSLVFVLIGNRINHLIKIFSLSFLFSISIFILSIFSIFTEGWILPSLKDLFLLSMVGILGGLANLWLTPVSYTHLTLPTILLV